MSNNKLNNILGAELDEEQLLKVSGGKVFNCLNNTTDCSSINNDGGAFCSSRNDHDCTSFAPTYGSN